MTPLLAMAIGIGGWIGLLSLRICVEAIDVATKGKVPPYPIVWLVALLVVVCWSAFLYSMIWLVIWLVSTALGAMTS